MKNREWTLVETMLNVNSMWGHQKDNPHKLVTVREVSPEYDALVEEMVLQVKNALNCCLAFDDYERPTSCEISLREVLAKLEAWRKE